MTKNEHDFGIVYPKTQESHQFIIKNTGDKNLKISKVKSSCGCTAYILKNNDIPPGGEEIILVTLDGNMIRGKIRKKIVIFSNDAKSPQYSLWIKANIRDQFQSIPKIVNFGKVYQDQEKDVTFKFVSFEKKDYKIYKVDYSKMFFEVNYEKIEPFKETQTFLFKVKVKKVVKFSPRRVRESIKIYTEENLRGYTNVQIIGEVLGNIEVKPQYLFQGNIPKGNSVSKTITLNHVKKIPFKILNLRSNNLMVTPEIVNKGGHTYQIKITTKEGIKQIRIAGSIIIETDNKLQEKIIVTYAFQYRRQ